MGNELVSTKEVRKEMQFKSNKFFFWLKFEKKDTPENIIDFLVCRAKNLTNGKMPKGELDAIQKYLKAADCLVTAAKMAKSSDARADYYGLVSDFYLLAYHLASKVYEDTLRHPYAIEGQIESNDLRINFANNAAASLMAAYENRTDPVTKEMLMVRYHSIFMGVAIDESRIGSLLQKHGGPFGTVIVKGGKIVGIGHNRVPSSNDPSRHGEMTAITHAGKTLGTFDLSGTELYTSCEPCPMCLSTIAWARVKGVYMAATQEDAAAIGFRDEWLYNLFGIKPSCDLKDKKAYVGKDENGQAIEMALHKMPGMRGDAVKVMEGWQNMMGKVEY